MIYQCDHCNEYFNQPQQLKENNCLYQDGIYRQHVCPHCYYDDYEEYTEIYEYNGEIYNQRSDLEILLEQQGKSEEEIKTIIDTEAYRMEEWEE